MSRPRTLDYDGIVSRWNAGWDIDCIARWAGAPVSSVRFVIHKENRAGRAINRRQPRSGGNDDGMAILQEESSRAGLTASYVVGRSRRNEVVAVRRVIARRLVFELGMTLLKAGAILQRDHTTIINLIDPEHRAAKHRRYMASVASARVESHA